MRIQRYNYIHDLAIELVPSNHGCFDDIYHNPLNTFIEKQIIFQHIEKDPHLLGFDWY